MYKCKIADQTDMGHEVHDFGVKDTRGRAIGAKVYYREIELVEFTPEQYQVYYALPAGYYYVATMRATRNGADYGASQPRKYFTTEAERDAAVAKYLKQARSRALKLAA